MLTWKGEGRGAPNVPDAAGSRAGVDGDGRRLELGGAHTIQYSGDVLWNCHIINIVLITSAAQ